MLNDIFPDFQRYLAEKNLVSSYKIPFHALWVSKFLAFSNKRQDKNLNSRISMFLDSLVKEKQLPDWQVEQAGNATPACIQKYEPIPNYSVLTSRIVTRIYNTSNITH